MNAAPPSFPPEPIQQAKRLNRAFGPVIAGLIIDLVDLSTFGPMGFYFGLPLGGGCGYWMGRTLGLTRKQSLYCAIAAGIYCMIPVSEFLPLATLVGAFARYRETSAPKAETPSSEEKNQAPKALNSISTHPDEKE
jgi:hypothetical protein